MTVAIWKIRKNTQIVIVAPGTKRRQAPSYTGSPMESLSQPDFEVRREENLPMRSDKITENRTRSSGRGFTLVEILVVIVVIALLVAILFPVFSKVQTNSRQVSSLSNMHEISVGLQKYQLDHDGASPPVLFGYAVKSYDSGDGLLDGPIAPMGSALGEAQKVKNQAQVYFPGLYPVYVSNVSYFVDPNNESLSTDVQSPNVNVLCPGDDSCSTLADGTLVVSTHMLGGVVTPGTFYAQDSYDLSPEVTGQRTIDTTTLVPRYQTSWTCADADPNTSTVCAAAYNQALPPDNSPNNYPRQLRNPARDGSTYITSTTYHIPQSGMALVLFQDGSARPVASTAYLSGGTDVAGIDTTTAPVPNASVSTIWKLR